MKQYKNKGKIMKVEKVTRPKDAVEYGSAEQTGLPSMLRGLTPNSDECVYVEGSPGSQEIKHLAGALASLKKKNYRFMISTTSEGKRVWRLSDRQITDPEYNLSNKIKSAL